MITNPAPDQSWRTIVSTLGAQFGSALTAGTYIFGAGGNKVVLAGAGSGFGVVELDPADFTGYNALVRLRAWVVCNSVDPNAGAWTFALAPVATYNGGSNVDPGIATLGSNVVTAAVTPTVSGTALATGTSAAYPAAGAYALAVTFGSNTATNSIERAAVVLQVQRN